mmetsp:Transcript_20512/g.58074  ORF Transcript_20512/g.58074 Transcript_20512/m.58074 type:complete len:213 (+) Transcript_20512:830-1468(+)
MVVAVAGMGLLAVADELLGCTLDVVGSVAKKHGVVLQLADLPHVDPRRLLLERVLLPLGQWEAVLLNVADHLRHVALRNHLARFRHVAVLVLVLPRLDLLRLARLRRVGVPLPRERLLRLIPRRPLAEARGRRRAQPEDALHDRLGAPRPAAAFEWQPGCPGQRCRALAAVSQRPLRHRRLQEHGHGEEAKPAVPAAKGGQRRHGGGTEGLL